MDGWMDSPGGNKALNVILLEERRVHADLTEVYKIIHWLSAIAYESFFEFDNSGRTMGHSLKLRKKESKDVVWTWGYIFSKSYKLVEQFQWSHCLSIIIELFQK